jgi:hypothetical protein
MWKFFTTIKKQTRNLLTQGKMALFALATALAFAPVKARAEGDIDDLFAAANITGLSSNVKTYIIAFIVIAVMFVGWKYIKRVSNRA